MKKVLLASTALVATAGWAMADVTNRGDAVGASIELRGEAWMGVAGGDFFEDETTEQIVGTDPDNDNVVTLETITTTTNDGEPQFFTDIDIKFVMVGQTDGGLEFGAEIDIDEAGDGSLFEDPTTEGGESLYISGAFGRLTMGDTDGALDWAMTETNIAGTLGDLEEHRGWNGNDGLDAFYDGQIARYEYAFADFAIAVSGELDDAGDGDPILGIGAKYAANFAGVDVGFGAGIQTISGLDDVGETFLDEDEEFDAVVWGVSADVALTQGIQAILNYSAQDADEVEGEYWGMAIGYEMGPLLVSANVGHFDDWVFAGASDAVDQEGYGVQANYDLGGGAQLEAGYSHDTRGDVERDAYSFGIQMNF